MDQDMSYDTSELGDETCHDVEEADVAAKQANYGNKEDKIATKETYRLFWMRVGLAAVLTAAAVLVSLVLYWLVKGAEEDDFQSAYEDNSGKLLEAFEEEAQRRLGAVASFAASLTAHTMATNATWPFVTIPQFEAQAERFKSLAGVNDITFAVVIEPEDRPEWENEFFPERAPAWVQESADYAGIDLTAPPPEGGGRPGGRLLGGHVSAPTGDYEGKPTKDSNGFTKEIFYRDVTPLGERGDLIAGNSTALVYWQYSPMIPSIVANFMNYDISIDENFDGRLLPVLQSQKSILGAMSARAYGGAADNPISGFYYPVLQGFTQLDDDVRLGGALATLLPWNSFFENILPENANGIIVVLKTSCGQAFTYQINGPEAILLGQGDLHDTSFDDTRREVSLDALLNKAVEDGSYQGLPLDDEGCKYSLQVYASADMKNSYISNDPIYYTIGAVLIFMLTSLIFIVYDRLSERRQRLVLSEAKKSGAIVSSLFPAEYKEKLMKEQEEKQRLEAEKAKAKSKTTSEFAKTFMLGGAQDYGDAFSGDGIVATPESPPQEHIAQLYPECTIFFADLAGFTQWSASRTPADVFTLLQTIFGRFDAVAKKRRVYKIETIGDCYLAVCGCPQAQRNHALIMAKFAGDCLLKMDGATRELAETLGEDTRDLQLRVGLHSGPITAGILRGEKSRFQVFGDTVNTGSRMESTGERNRIHVSAATADLLVQKHGKSSWVTPREELVEAKGKGKMQTYWVTPDRGQTGSVVSEVMSGVTSTSAGSSEELMVEDDTTEVPKTQERPTVELQNSFDGFVEC